MSLTPTPAIKAAAPTGDQLRAIMRDARKMSGPSDPTSPQDYILAGYRAALATPAIQAAQVAPDLASDMQLVMAEVQQARDNWPPFNSAHEGYAVMLEEVHELQAHVWTNQKRRDLPKMRKEAMQVAAMALRFMGECCDETTGRK